jgi:iron complex outermembrane receptor protein
MAGDTASTEVNELVVTAQKRSESLVAVPISITAVNKEQLGAAGVNDVAGLQRVVPGFTMAFAGAESQPTIRGVGTQVAGPGLPSNVAIYQDGFYQPNAIVNNIPFPDVSSVEVLKGPQGELYGRNATGGAILVTTEDPQFHPTGEMDLSYRSYNDARLGFFFTGPISSQLAASISAYASRYDDYNTNIVNGKSAPGGYTMAFHGKLLYQPTDKLSFLLSMQYLEKKEPNVYVNGDYQGIATGGLFGGIVATQPYQYSYDYAPRFKARVWDGSLKTSLDLPFATLTSLTHGQLGRNISGFDIDQTSLPIEAVYFPGIVNNVSQEFDLISKGKGPLQWMFGTDFFYDDDSDIFNLEEPAPPVQVLHGGVNIYSFAVYGDATYNVWKRLYLTVGARYSNDYLKEHFGAPGVPETYASKSFDKITPRAVIRYEVTDNANVYASYSTGYKSGGFNPNGFSTLPVEPETITAYEAGFKQAGRGFRLEAAGFYYFYSNLQVNQYLGDVTVLLNAARAHIYGAEVGGSVDFWDHFTLGGGLSYTHATYASFPNAPKYSWEPSVATCPFPAPGHANTTGICIAPADASGNPLPNSPEFSAKVDLTYRHELPVGSLELNANVNYQTEVYFDPYKQIRQAPYALARLRASWISPEKKYELSVFCDNVGGQAYLDEAFQQPVVFAQHWGPPRVVGGELKVHF